MAELKPLLELRAKIKAKKPEFIRQDNPKRMKLNYKWRKPKGIHSKIRHHFKGRRKMPSPGYKSPIAVRGLHATGLKMVMVFSPNDLSKVDNKAQGIIIPKDVGTKKRYNILKKAKEMNIKVLNLNIEESMKKIEHFMSSKKKKEAKDAKKEQKKETKRAEDESKEMTDEQKKEAEKKEKDKVLTKRA